MFAQKGLISHLGRTAVMAGVAAIALTAVEPMSAIAAPAAKEKGLTATSGATDFSARSRRYYRGGGAAAAAAFAGIVGTGLAIAASRPYYDSYGYYGGPPVAYYGGPAYYGGGPYYGGYGYYPNGGRYVGGYNTGQYW
jgi:hypothetical protein